MKIGRKLNISILIIIAGFIVSIALLVQTANTARTLQGLTDTAQTALLEASGATIVTQNLVTTRRSLELVYAEYIERRESALSAMEDLAAHPGLDLLDEDVRTAAEGAISVWNLNAQQFARSEENIELVLASDLPAGVTFTGIMHMLRQSEQYDDAQTSLLRLRLSNAETTIDRVISFAGEFVLDRLGAITTAISDTAIRTVERNLLVALSVATAVSIFSFAFMFFFTRRISRRITRVVGVVDSIAQRDLTVSYTDRDKDEIGELSRDVNTVIESVVVFLVSVGEAVTQADQLQESLGAANEESASALNQITKNIENIRRRFSDLDSNVTTSSGAVASINEKVHSLNDEIGRQSDSMTSISSSVEQMTASIQSVARLSEDRRAKADEITSIARDGSEKMDATNSVIRSVSQDVDDILEIIEIINGVSEQTHLLSMNAAIESAHAGEAGRGFAVVAEEIRKLAESTSENATNIDRTLRQITEKINEALRSSALSLDAFEEIHGTIAEFSSAMNEISHSMQELSVGSREVLQSTEGMKELSERIRSDSTLMADSSREIRDAMSDAEGISKDVVNGIAEIDTGAREILESMVGTGELTAENRERMQALGTLVNSYKMPDSEPLRPVDSVGRPHDSEEVGISLLEDESDGQEVEAEQQRAAPYSGEGSEGS